MHLSQSLLPAAKETGRLMVIPDQTANWLLASLAAEDFALIKPDLKRVELHVRKQLEQRNREVEFAYFPESGLASVLAHGGATNSVEVGVVGKEGMTGLPVVLQNDHSAHEIFVHVAGTAWRLEASSLRDAIARSPALHSVFLRYASVMIVQMGSAALANARFRVDARLARWLLMAQDRIEGPEVPLTHEFLALMLGTRRAGISTALGMLKKKGILEMSRAAIVIKNRDELLEVAQGCYGAPEAEYARFSRILPGPHLKLVSSHP